MAKESKYSIWLGDPLGVRLGRVDFVNFFSYQKFVDGLGSCRIGIPFNEFKAAFNPFFVKDRRIEIWRAPILGARKRLEGVFWIRRFKVYTRADGVEMIEFTGRDAQNLLDRRTTPPISGTAFTSKDDFADDMAKAIVRENLGSLAVDEDGNYDANRDLTLTGQFSVQKDVSLVVQLEREIARKNVLDEIKAIRNAAEKKGTIFHFDTVALTPTSFQFQTFTEVRGTDRTETMLPFSVENGSLRNAYYEEDYWDERNFIYSGGAGVNASRVIGTVLDQSSIDASPWGRSEAFFNAPGSATEASAEDAAEEELEKRKALKRFDALFLSVPGGDGVPRSLYGLDWDFGDRVPVKYAGLNLSADIKAVFISVDKEGKESITARNVVGV